MLMCVRRATNGLLNVPSATRCDVWWLIGPSLWGGPATVCGRDSLLQSIKGRHPLGLHPPSLQLQLKHCDAAIRSLSDTQKHRKKARVSFSRRQTGNACTKLLLSISQRSGSKWKKIKLAVLRFVFREPRNPKDKDWNKCNKWKIQTGTKKEN